MVLNFIFLFALFVRLTLLLFVVGRRHLRWRRRNRLVLRGLPRPHPPVLDRRGRRWRRGHRPRPRPGASRGVGPRSGPRLSNRKKYLCLFLRSREKLLTNAYFSFKLTLRPFGSQEIATPTFPPPRRKTKTKMKTSSSRVDQTQLHDLNHVY